MRGDDQANLAKALAEWGQTPAEAPPEDYEVWPENHAAIQLFLACQNCWKKLVVSNMAGAQIIYDGLDYTQVAVVMDMLFADVDKADVFNRLIICEREAISLLNSQG